MNLKMVRYVLGRIFLLEGVLMFLPLLVAFYYGEAPMIKIAYAKTIALLLILGLIWGLKKPDTTRYYTKEGFVITGLAWILVSFFGGLPFYFTGEIPSVVDCFFEMASGFTTTGSSIITDLTAMSNSGLFWRSFSHFVGGMGFLVLALAVMPKIEPDTIHIMKAEVPGPVFGKLVSRLSHTARILYVIYTVMTIILVGILVVAGLPLFDATLHAFGAAGTGGFGIKNGSVAFYQNPAVEMILGVAMIVFGINFNLHFLVLTGHVKEALKDDELKWFLKIIAIAIALICFNLFPNYDNYATMVRDAFFSVSSVITTTGYSTADFGQWPLLSQLVLLLIMFVGACAGSTAGGLKVSRVVMLGRSAIAECKRYLNPNRKVSVIMNDRGVPDQTLSRISNYFVVYMMIFVALLVIIAFDVPDFLTAFSAVAATFNNIGPGLGKVGPAANFSHLSDISKITLSIGMIVGRLEIFPIVVLFSPSTWRKRH